MIRKISAHYVLPVTGRLFKYGIVVCSHTGEILDVTDTGGILRERASVEFYDGILVPGFVKIVGETDRLLFESLKRMMNENPDTMEQCIRSLTLDRAVGNGTDMVYGSLEKNKFPGIYLISAIDFSAMRVKTESRLRILVPQGEVAGR